MASKSGSDIQILVGLSGGGSIHGASGKLIQSQIASIMGSIANGSAGKLHIKHVVVDPTATASAQAAINAANISIAIDTITVSQKAIDSLQTSISGAMVNQTLDSITIDQSCLQKMADDIKQKIETMPAIEVPWKWKTNNNNPPGPKPGSGGGKKSQQQIDLENVIRLEKEKIRLETQYQAKLHRRGNESERNKVAEQLANFTNPTGEYLTAKNSYVAQYGQADLDAAIAKNHELTIAMKHRDVATQAAIDRENKLHQNETVSFDKIAVRAQEYFDKNGATLAKNQKLYSEYLAFLGKINDEDVDKKFADGPKQANAEYMDLIQRIGAAQASQETFGQKVTRIFKEKFGYGVMAAAAQAARRSIHQLYTNVIELDDAMAQMKIVTGASTKALKEYSEGAADAAKATGRTMTEIMASSTEYARLGYNLEESLRLSETTAKLSNVADIDTAEATTAMTSILKGFRLEAKDAEMVGDMMTKVANEYAIDAGELGAALERGGASLAAANNTLAESMALMAAGNAAIQNAETVGKQHCPAA